MNGKRPPRKPKNGNANGAAIRWKVLYVTLIALRLGLAAVILATGFATYRLWDVVSSFPRAAAAIPPPRVGIIAGHWESDSGAVCPDGLQEVEITLDIARRAVEILRRLGYEAELLPEYSDKLDGYAAAALVSIHADSCLPERSGFKIARLIHSAIPDEENRLVVCLYEEYSKTTGLLPDEDTITADMTGYHAFRAIAPQTPGAIIEIGYMGGDRRLLTRQGTRVARGIAAGIIRFLEGE